MSINTKVYIDKDGNKRVYRYENTWAKRHKKLQNLAQQKWYYKKRGELEKVRTIELMIAVEKRREKIENEG